MSEEMKKQKARENARRYYQKNKQKVLAKQKEYVKKKYATDEEFRKKTYERSRKYVKNNIEKVREWKRKWANKHYKELREKGLLPPSKQEVIEDLQQKVEQLENKIKYAQKIEQEYSALLTENTELENIRKEAIESIERGYVVFCKQDEECLLNFRKNMLNILNKGSNKE